MAQASKKQEEEARILPPDPGLKRKFGTKFDFQLLVNDTVVKHAEAVMEKHKPEFVKHISNEFRTMKTRFEQAQKGGKPDEARADIAGHAFTIKSEAGSFGYTLASQIARNLVNFCENGDAFDEDAQLVIKSHIDALNVIFQQDITGNGGPMGQEIVRNLQILTEQFS